METHKLQAAPHFDHWSTALAWLIGEIAVITQVDLKQAQRTAVRFNPLYMRFIAGNSVTAGELTSHLVMQANASLDLKRSLGVLTPLKLEVSGLSTEMAWALIKRGDGLLPPQVRVIYALPEENRR